MEWRPAGWSVYLPVNLPLHHKSRSSFLSPAHLGGPGKMAVKWLCVQHKYGYIRDKYVSMSEEIKLIELRFYISLDIE